MPRRFRSWQLVGLASLLVIPSWLLLIATAPPPVEAPAGFDDQTNGYFEQAEFDVDRAGFESREDVADGLGPVYNAQSCAECHRNPVTGGTSQITELRVGRYDGEAYSDPPGGSLVNDRAIAPELQEKASTADNVRTFRTSLNVLGDGFLEAVADATIEQIRNAQPAEMRGTLIKVPVLEAGGALRTARFGWKNQHASLLSFAADAYLNEMGITSTLMPTENTSRGVSTAAWDTVPDPEDKVTANAPNGEDVTGFVRFMRSSKAPSSDAVLAATADAVAGRKLFGQIGCATCHTPTMTTAAAGTAINGGTFTIPEALGSKVIHPFSDLLLHDVGTGDGIVQNGGPGTRNQLRTPPLWGVRTRARLMHDGESLTKNDAILRHGGQAAQVTARFLRLRPEERRQLVRFLDSL